MPQTRVIDKKGMDAIFSGVISQDSGVTKPDSKLLTTESGESSRESGVTKPESELPTKESEVGGRESGVTKPESELPTKESGVGSRESVVRVMESGVNMGILAQAIKQGTENPRISSWNPLVMAVLRYKNLTTPAYSMSKEISELLEIAIKERYPDLSEQVEKAFAKK